MLLTLGGSLALGIVLGWLLRFFLDRFERFDAKILAAVVSILVGGVVTRFLGGDPYRVSVWAYPIGLLVGIIVYPVISAFDDAAARHRSNRRSKSPRPENRSRHEDT